MGLHEANLPLGLPVPEADSGAYLTTVGVRRKTEGPREGTGGFVGLAR